MPDPTKPIRVELHIVKATGRQTSLDIVWKIIPENIPMVLVKDTPINVTYYRVVNHKKDERSVRGKMLYDCIVLLNDVN